MANTLNRLSERVYNRMSRSQKIKWLEEQRRELDRKEYRGDDGDEECFGRYLEFKSESCNMCGMKQECMDEMPSKLDVVLEKMGVELED